MKKWNSAWAGLAISYGSIVVIIVLLICSFFYIYFSRSYNEELKNKNQLILENTARTIEGTVLQRVQQMYVDLSLDKSANISMFADKASNRGGLDHVVDLQELLKAKVAGNADISQAIHLYYPKQNIMLSSLYGLRYDADQGESAAYYTDWIQEMRTSKHNSLWTPSRHIPKDIFSSIPADTSNDLFTYAHSYPFRSTGETSDVIIAIDVKESAINQIIENMMPSQYKETFVVNRAGNPVSNTNQDLLMQDGKYESSMMKALNSGHAKGSFDEEVNDVSSVVSYQTLPSTDWMIYSATPSSFYYKQATMIQQLILVICLVAIVVGLALSAVLVRANYSPIKRLVGRVKHLSGPSPKHITNEYHLIDSAFNQLNDKVSDLEETLLANSSAIRQKAILHLLHGGYTPEQWAEDLPALGISPQQYSAYCCLLLNTGGAHLGIQSDNLSTASSRLIHGLESLSLPNSHLIAEELPDKKLVVILCTNLDSEPLLDQLSHLLSSEAKQQFHREIQLSAGPWVQELTDVHESFSEAQTLMKYAYFVPELTILNDRSILQREHNLEEIPQSMLTRFRDKLHARQLEEAIKALDQFIATMRKGLYPANYCHFMLANAVFVYSDVVKNVRYKHPLQHGQPDLYQEYVSIGNILAYRNWLVESITVFISETENRNSDRAVSTIGLAKQYIKNHLSEDLSLEAVATQVFISPKYLSKLFKEEMGVTYTDYITSQRMERAKELIESNNMTVERIASSVGYGTTAYFIKRFKDMYGCTPGHYLRNISSAAMADADL
ncbi:AraC family transcriptional regulator [Paenibacillus sp. PCH8]|uniref:helix-turn-helix domain-containing protein n=1 Tax=Paenibacillus sp. PCH8 TaxID=2066524 RepID=UPI000CF9FBD1|nr:helix-turn-helix domain-containing protein [Paenibacillus sp. PCH8]PQP84194.1 AraC family transcriptional regulator [Paenibacillus sp. PCH8]